MSTEDSEKRLNIGCGKFPKKGYINLDFRSDVGADVVHDLEELPLPFENNYFTLIEADHVLEHMKCPFAIMRELARITKPGGTISIRVPHFSRAFTHPDHKCGFDVSFPLYFSPSFSGGYEDVELKLVSMQLTWFAQRYLKKVTLSSFQYAMGVFLSNIFDLFANASPYACSRLWCFWVGGFEEIHYVFQLPDAKDL